MTRCPLGTNSVMVGLDRRPSSARAVAWAADEARRTGMGLWLVHVWNWSDHPARVVASLEDPVDNGHRLLGEVAEPLRASGLAVAVSLLDGPPADVLVEALDSCAMLVLGADHRGPVGRVIQPSVAMSCLHHAARPVVLAGDREPMAPRGRVTVGVDGSDHSLRALRWATDEARSRAAALRVVHAWGYPGGLYWTTGEGKREARDILTAAVDSVGDANLTIEPRLHEGRVAAGLLHEARDSDLLVVGSHGRGSLGTLVLGSVSTACVHQAEWPVAVVPPPHRVPSPPEPAVS